LPRLRLFAQLNKGPESEFYGFPLCLRTSKTKGVFHEFVVNDNVGSHGVYLKVAVYTLYPVLQTAET